MLLKMESLFFNAKNVFDFIYATTLIENKQLEKGFYASNINGRKILININLINNNPIFSGKIGGRTCIIIPIKGTWMFYWNDYCQYRIETPLDIKRFNNDVATSNMIIDLKRKDLFDLIVKDIVCTSPLF